jgi:hypothetical protein
MATQKLINDVTLASYPVTASIATTFPPLNSLRNCGVYRKNDKDPPM